ncbi:hypothetical protein [Alkaliflexus imshenetskii]|uniref:hypothetical protein n=1 Tax=Alkaliflexus imshenetskii TaxID=286730 RepID=UPI00047CA879|nr:hypothetical protein [Alkaliflexus imshenetskii]
MLTKVPTINENIFAICKKINFFVVDNCHQSQSDTLIPLCVAIILLIVLIGFVVMALKLTGLIFSTIEIGIIKLLNIFGIAFNFLKL